MLARRASLLHSLGCRYLKSNSCAVSPALRGGHSSAVNNFNQCFRNNSRSCSSSSSSSHSASTSEYVMGQRSGSNGQPTATTGKECVTVFSNGYMGHLSESSIVCSANNTVIHASVNSQHNPDPSSSFLPLTVDYRARQYAFGVIPQARNRRERHGSEIETLVARIIDRAIRPLFPKGYVEEVQLTVTMHAADGIGDPVVTAVNAASYALMSSKQPWMGPIGCTRIGMVDGKLKVNPTVAEMEESPLDFLYAGTASKALMIETVGQQIPEVTIAAALRLAQASIQPVIEAQRNTKIRSIDDITAIERAQAIVLDSSIVTNEASASEAIATVPTTTDEVAVLPQQQSVVKYKKRGHIVPMPLLELCMSLGWQDAVDLYSMGCDTRKERSKTEGMLRAQLLETLKREATTDHLLPEALRQPHPVQLEMAVEAVMTTAFRSVILDTGLRSDGRDVSQLRALRAATAVLPDAVHGSSFFVRGDTHVLGTATLGPRRDSATYLTINGSGKEHTDNFMLHYDFPPYATGELGNTTVINRRMVGHGNLAERALRPVIPSLDSFPYAMRVFGECTSSNGSSSMAAVCAGTLALYDAGVPLLAPVAGVSIGLVTENDGVSVTAAAAAANSSASATKEEASYNHNIKYFGADSSVLVNSLAEDDDEDNSPAIDSTNFANHSAVGEGYSARSIAAYGDGSSPVSLTRKAVPTSALAVAANSLFETNDDSIGSGSSSSSNPATIPLPKRYRILTDIMGSEDHHGDMDFKVAGTVNGITAIQLDVKLPGGVHLDLLEESLLAAKEGRLKILQTMLAAAPTPRATFKPQTPRAELVKFDPERLGQLLGPSGATVHNIEEVYDCNIEVDEEDHIAYIFGKSATQVAKAKTLVKDIAVTVKEGDIVKAKVAEVMDFGLLVEINRAQRALLPVFFISHDKSLLKQPLNEIIRVGQKMDVQITHVDKAAGLIRVSRKALLDEHTSVPDFLDGHANTAATFVGEQDAVEDTEEGEGELFANITEANFPTKPVRKWNRDFFKKNIVSKSDILRAMEEKKDEAIYQQASSTVSAGGSNTNSNTNSNNNRSGDIDRRGGSGRIVSSSDSSGNTTSDSNTSKLSRERGSQQQYERSSSTGSKARDRERGSQHEHNSKNSSGARERDKGRGRDSTVGRSSSKYGRDNTSTGASSDTSSQRGSSSSTAGSTRSTGRSSGGAWSESSRDSGATTSSGISSTRSTIRSRSSSDQSSVTTDDKRKPARRNSHSSSDVDKQKARTAKVSSSNDAPSAGIIANPRAERDSRSSSTTPTSRGGEGGDSSSDIPTAVQGATFADEFASSSSTNSSDVNGKERDASNQRREGYRRRMREQVTSRTRARAVPLHDTAGAGAGDIDSDSTRTRTRTNSNKSNKNSISTGTGSSTESKRVRKPASSSSSSSTLASFKAVVGDDDGADSTATATECVAASARAPSAASPASSSSSSSNEPIGII